MKKLKVTLILLFITGISFSQTAGITISDGTNFKVSGNVIVNIDNLDFVNNSSESLLGGTFIFSGTTNQEITGTAESEFSNLEVTNNVVLTLGNNILIIDELTFNQGIINIQDYDLTLSENIQITGTPSSSNMINAEGAGSLIRNINNTGTSYMFPVGDNTSDYSPVLMTFNSGTYNNANVSINLSDTKHPNNTSSTDYLSRYWTINSSGISAFDCDLEFTYAASGDIFGDEANIFGALWNGSNWSQLDQASGYKFTGNVGEFGDFTGVEESIFTDIFHLEYDQFLINYSNGTIHIFSPNDMHLTHAELYNSIGQLIDIYDLNGQGLNKIQYSGSRGYYLLKIYTDNSFITKKIIIN